MILDQMLKNKALSRTISSVGVGKYELLSGGAECGNRKEAAAACIFRIHHRRPWSMLIPNKKFREMLIMKILSLHGPKFDTKRMALAAMLIALQIILEKLSVGDPAVWFRLYCHGTDWLFTGTMDWRAVNDYQRPDQ